MQSFNEPMIQGLIAMSILTLPLKVIGLWKSARNNQKGWFAAMLLLNTLGLVELTYLFYFSKPKNTAKE